MKKLSIFPIVFLFLLNNIALTQCLEDNQIGTNTLSGTTGFGQTFTACLTGQVDIVEFQSGPVFGTNSVDLALLDGACQVIWTLTNIGISPNEIRSVDLSFGSGTSREVVSGQTYSFEISYAGGNVAEFVSESSNPYPNGDAITTGTSCTPIANEDLWFKVHMSVPDCPPSGPVVLSSQAEVDNFIITYPNCQFLNVDLTISGADIDDLSPLANLIELVGNLDITNNPNLASLSGLDNLQVVLGELNLSDNANLTDLSALEKIQEVYGLTVELNNSMTDLTGLDNLTKVFGEVSIQDNPSLLNLDALPVLDLVEDNLVIHNNASLNSIGGMNSLASLNDTLDIQQNPNLSNCSIASVCNFINCGGAVIAMNNSSTPGCNSVAEITSNCASATCCPSNVTILSQADVDNFATNYPGCTQIFGSLTIIDANNLLGLSQVTSIGTVLNILSPNLTDLQGLHNITSVGDILSISNCDNLSDLQGLEGLTSVGGRFDLSFNDNLISLNGLTVLATVDGSFNVEDNADLVDFTGLSNLTTMEDLWLFNNPSLIDFTGLTSLTTIEEDLEVTGNNALVSFAGLESLTTLGKHVNINNNAVLQSLQGLNNIVAFNPIEPVITNCPMLDDCAVESICTYLSNGGTIAIGGNSTGCNSQTEVTNICTCNPVISPDYDALAALYDSTSGDGWTNNTGWVENCDPCGEVTGTPWFGVTCDGGLVTQIDLSNNNLTGNLPIEIGDLQFLEQLHLGMNNLSDTIPDEICINNQLTHLNLGNNALTGNIPACLSDNIFLVSLDLSENDFDGTLPVFDSDNPDLTHLLLQGNQFTGQIPPQYEDLKNTLVSFNVSNNSLSGAFALELGALCALGLTNAEVSDGNSFLQTWEDFCLVPCAYVPDDNFEQALIDLGYDTGPLDDCVPIPNIETVTTLDVSNEAIESMEGIEFFAALQNLDCSNNELLSLDVSENTALVTLNASDNMITCFDLGLDNLSNLTTLDASNNNIAGCWPNEMGDLCASLSTFDFDGNNYDGTNNFISNAGWTAFCNDGTGACVGAFDGWSNLGAGLINGVPRALATDNFGNLYAGGLFTQAGGQSVSNIAKWNASTQTWTNLGAGLNGWCGALVTDASGNLYAGGWFTQAGGQPASRVAKWDATTQSWSNLGLGLNGTCIALAMDASGNLYAGGWFTQAGGQPATQVVKWDNVTQSWLNMGADLNGQFSTLSIDISGNLYVGGQFTQAGGQSASNIAKWNASTQTWTNLGAGLNGWCIALVTDASGNLYAGGGFSQAGGQSANRVAKWSNTTQSWTNLGTGLSWSCFSLAIDDSGNLYAGGNFTGAGGQPASNIAKWDDATQSWSNVGTGLNDMCNSLAYEASGNLYAGGIFTQAGGEPAARIAKYTLCQESTIITCEPPKGKFSASNLIQASSQLGPANNVTLNAPNILLNAGFSVELGSQLQTQSGGCN